MYSSWTAETHSEANTKAHSKANTETHSETHSQANHTTRSFLLPNEETNDETNQETQFFFQLTAPKKQQASRRTNNKTAPRSNIFARPRPTEESRDTLLHQFHF